MPKPLSLVITIFAILVVLLLVLGLLSLVPMGVWDWIDNIPLSKGAYFALGAILTFVALSGIILKQHERLREYSALYGETMKLCSTLLDKPEPYFMKGYIFTLVSTIQTLLWEIDPERFSHQNNHQKGE